MELTEEIIVRRTTHSRLQEVDFDKLGFGTYISDHMLITNFKDGQWETPQIVPFGNLSLSPTTLALHYGQAVFEGMKAFKLEDGRINLFRVHKHYERFMKSLHRMCMAVVPEDIFVEGLRKLVEVDNDWIPTATGSSLYIRPLMFASEAKFGVKVSDEYCFLAFTGPVSPAFGQPIKLKVETHYIRAARGGTGFAKCAGNYGAAFYPTQLAREEGFDQVMWTDAFRHEFIEESGTMNLMFVIDGTLVTPPVSDSILDGITRDSLLQIAGELGITVEERPVSINEIISAHKQNKLTEAFGAGTAAVVAPISAIGIDGEILNLPAYHPGNVMFQLKKELEDIRTGKKEDRWGWNHVVEL